MELIAPPRPFGIDDRSQVPEARRAATRLAQGSALMPPAPATSRSS
jgi:hypothetical protein